MNLTMMQPTADQRRRYGEYTLKWWSIEKSTRPADRPRAEAAIAGLYRLAQLEAPRVIWLPCALSAALSAILYGAFRYPGAGANRCIGSNAPRALWHAIAQQLNMAKSAIADPCVPQGQSLKRPAYSIVGYVVGCAMNYSLHNVQRSENDCWVDAVVQSNVRRALNWIERSAEGYGPDYTLPDGTCGTAWREGSAARD